MSALSHNYPGVNLNGSHSTEHRAQAEKINFGFWVFVMSDMITFALLIATYAASTNVIGMAGGPGPQDLFSLPKAGFQTALLLISSLTAGFASLSLKYHEGHNRIGFWLIVTAFLGLVFVWSSVLDFRSMIAEGAGPDRSGWLSSYFALLGLHMLHMIAGIVWIFVMLALMVTQGWTAVNSARLLMFTVFWHFLDIVWIAIFSIVFLGGLA